MEYHRQNWQFEGVSYAVTISVSTYKHGRNNQDVWCVLDSPIWWIADGYDPDDRTRLFVIGTDTKTRVTEVLILLDSADTATVIHAHKPTAHTLRLICM